MIGNKSNSKISNESFFSKTDDFINIYLTKQADKSPLTARSYKYCLGHFYDYVVTENGIHPFKFKYSDCTCEFVLNYSQYMQKSKNWSRSTINLHISAIKKYLEYVSGDNVEVVQIWYSLQKVHSLKITKHIKPIIESKDRAAYFNAPDNTRLGNRDRTILLLLYDTAARVSELSGIRIGDVIFENGTPTKILLRGKGRKERLVVLSDDAATLLKAYIKAFHKSNVNSETPLFFTKIDNKIKHMSVRNIQRIVEKYGIVARESNPDIPNTHPHLLRRTRATDLYRDGVPLDIVSVFLGHSSVETTTIYATPSPEQLREASNQSYNDVLQDEKPLWETDAEALKKLFGLT